MISLGEKNMTQIAFELGFSSLQHFSTAFKKHTVFAKKIKSTPVLTVQTIGGQEKLLYLLHHFSKTGSPQSFFY